LRCWSWAFWGWVGLGWGTVRLLNPHGERAELASGRTLLTRLYYWKAALGGIAARPLFGWGGGVFEHHWPRYLSKASLESFIREEFRYSGARLEKVGNVPYGDPVFILKRPDGNLVVLRVYSFRAHNQFLEVGLKWGLVGVALYCLLLFLLLPGVPLLSPGGLGLLGLHLFLLLWFAIPEGEGAIWALWGASAVGCKGKRKGA